MGNYKQISERDIKAEISSRIRLLTDRDDNPVYCHGLEIDGAVILNESRINQANTKLVNLVFQDCKFNLNVSIGDSSQAGIVIFSNCIFENKVSISSTRNCFFKTHCHFKDDLNVEYYDVKGVEISNITFDKNLILSGRNDGEIALKNLNIDGEIQEQRLKINSTLLKSISITNVKASSISFNKTIFESDAKIKNVQLRDLELNDCKINQIFQLISSNISNKLTVSTIYQNLGELKVLENTFLNEVSLNISQIYKATISDCTINNLALTGANKKEDIINIQKCEIISLKIEEVYNNGLFTLKGINIPLNGKLSILSSNIGKTDFIRCDFSEAILEFDNSKIIESFFAETDFPTIVRLGDKETPSQSQLAFGQLATTFQKQGDTVRALEYQSRELQAHYKGLKFFSKDIFKTFNLWLNLVSNYFGRYWMRGIIFTFIVGNTFFCFLLLSTDEYQLGYPTINENLVPAFLKFMNPLRFFDVESLFKSSLGEVKISSNGWTYFWDFWGRIFVAYGFYQTIQAFRRYGRK
jgi:hypothetical protein